MHQEGVLYGLPGWEFGRLRMSDSETETLIMKPPVYRQEYPELFWGTNMNMKNISDYDSQETIAQLL